jgi:16S rRNA (uracil1498-N3)-methyltransferase
MHRCLIQKDRLAADVVRLSHDEGRHLQAVLRVRVGEAVELFDGGGATRLAGVRQANRDGVELEARGPCVMHAPLACALTLFACVSKGTRMDWTVEKAVELGVSRLVPVLSERTIVRLDEGDADAKVGRWSRVAAEAARQCGAVWLPEIEAPCALSAAAVRLAQHAPVFVAALSPQARPLREALVAWGPGVPPRAGWFVGPEGDFTPGELDLLIGAGALPVSLGRNVLRTETAAVYGLCVLGCAWLQEPSAGRL